MQKRSSKAKRRRQYTEYGKVLERRWGGFAQVPVEYSRASVWITPMRARAGSVHTVALPLYPVQATSHSAI